MIEPRSLFAAVAASTVLIAGCSPDSTDFKKEAEKAINKSDQFEAANCAKPDSTDVGTKFACTATLTTDQSTIQLTATIDKKNHFSVEVAADTGTTGSSVAGDGTGSTESSVAGDTTETTTG